MKRATLQNRIKRVTAAALCAVCLAGLCSQSISAASTGGAQDEANEIQLRYPKNQDGNENGAFVLLGNGIDVELDIGEFGLPKTGSALSVLDSDTKSTFPAENYSLGSGTTKSENGKTITTVPITVTKTSDTATNRGHVMLELTGNVSSITPPDSGYRGSVVVRSSGSATGADGGGTARLRNTPSAIAGPSTIVLRCTQGQDVNTPSPTFEVYIPSPAPTDPNAYKKPTGIFEDYDWAAIQPTHDNTNLDYTKPTLSGRRVVVELSKGGQNAMELEFPQVGSYGKIKTADGTGWMDAAGNTYDPADPQKTPYTEATAPPAGNNYFRQGEIYTFTFDKPRSNVLQLEVATKEWVANDIAGDVQGDLQKDNTSQERRYIKLLGRDTLTGVIAESAMTLITKDERYNATFGIRWEWVPTSADDFLKDPPEGFDKDNFNEKDYTQKAQNAIDLPNQTNATTLGQITPTVNHEYEEDITGTLYAILLYGNKSLTVPADGYSDKPYTDDNHGDWKVIETPKEGTVIGAAFPLIIRGKGVPGKVTPVSQQLGQEEIDYTDKTQYPDGPPAMPARLAMDVFKGDTPGYSTPPIGPWRYTFNLNMGMKRARALYALVTLKTTDGEDVVQLYKGDDLQSLSAGAGGTQTLRVDNPRGNAEHTDAGEVELSVQAASEGKVTMTIEFYIDVNGEERPDPNATRVVELEVSDTSPSQDSTLSGLLLQSRKDGKTRTYDYGFTPDNKTYLGPIKLPYAYEEYTITPTVNDMVIAKKPIRVRVYDTSGAQITELDKLQALLPKISSIISDGTDLDGRLVAPYSEMLSGDVLQLKLGEDKVREVYEISFEVEAQDPRFTSIYRLRVQRQPPSTEDRLSSLGIFAEKDTSGQNSYLTGFSPDNEGPYIIQVPYGTERLRIAASPMMENGEPVVAEIAYVPELSRITALGKQEYLELLKGPLANKDNWVQVPGAAEGTTLPCLYVYVTPESRLKDTDAKLEDKARRYQVLIDRLPPSEESRLTALTVVDAGDGSANPQSLPYSPSLNQNQYNGEYRMIGQQALPYNTKSVKFKVTPKDETVSGIYIYSRQASTGGEASTPEVPVAAGGWTRVAEITNPQNFSKAVELKPRNDDPASPFMYNDVLVLVLSEKCAGVSPESFLGSNVDSQYEDCYSIYRFEIERNPPSTDSDMLNLVTKDQEGKEIKLYSFHKDELSYSFKVPYETEKVAFNPTLSEENAKVELRSSASLLHSTGLFSDKLTPGSDSKFYELGAPGSPVTFTFTVKAQAYEVWPEAQYTKTYTVTIDREPPSKDARLKRLEASGITEDGLSPVFKASQLTYSATVEMGTREVTITPTANEPHATIRVNGEVVASGTACEPFELVEEHTLVPIEVTAQDGITKQTYVIDFYNPNLVELTDNADLASLQVERGLMTPEFEAAVINYEVAVKEDTWSVDIIPKTADPLATFKVLEGSREMGDYNGNYALALKDGANTVTVQVTSPDGTRTKEYKVTIYRNQEDKLKNLTPLTAEDLGEEIFKDESVNPIIISVVEYPRIHSDVFQALKDATADDPDKTIVLQGNDFSLTFRGADLDTIIPAREIYDFSMSFTSPDADKIDALISGHEGNEDIEDEVVKVYFDYHGDLPGTATLHLTLGGKYASQPLYWHYYNRERDRIDYYGTVQANSQGTFAVRIDHFSTYLVSRNHMIAGAEDRSGSVSLSVTGVGVNGKVNPQTGIRHDAPGEEP